MKTLLKYKNKVRCLTTRGLADFADAWEHPTIDKRFYKQLACELFILIVQKMVNEKFKYILPYGMGTMYVGQQQRSMGSQPVDWAATRKKGEIVRHQNLKSNNMIFKYVWRRPHDTNNNLGEGGGPGRFIDVYYFKPSRPSKNYLHEQIEKTSKDPYLKPYSTPYATHIY